VVLSSAESHVTIGLSESNHILDEVVVSAGGLKSRKKEQGYNATEIKAEELTNIAPVDVTSSLSGKVPGPSLRGINMTVHLRFGKIWLAGLPIASMTAENIPGPTL
jgi:hypothetical protein